MYKILAFLLLSTLATAQTVVRKGTASGTNEYTVAFVPPITAFNSNTIYTITFTNSNTAALVTLDPTGVVPETEVRDNGGSTLAVGALKAGGTYNLIYDGINLRAIDVTTSTSNNVTWATKTTNYTPLITDAQIANLAFLMQSANDISLTIPPYTSADFPSGQQFRIKNGSTGNLSILEGTGVNFESIDAGPWILSENEQAIATKLDSVTWDLQLFRRPRTSQETSVAIYTDVATAGNVTTGEDLLFTYTLDAGTLAADGNTVRGRFSGIFANNDNDKTLRLKFGGTTIASRTAINTPSIGQGWVMEYEIIRVDEENQKANITFSGIDGIVNGYYIALTEDLTTDLDIELTGEATATDDIVKHTASARFDPGAGGGSTPPPIEPPVTPFVVTDNTVKGDQGYQHEYVGTWPENLNTPGWLNNTLTYSATTNDYVEFKFNGTKVHWFTEVRNTHGIAAVSIDGGAETNVDLYSATQTQQVNVWTSGTLTQAEHTIKIRVTGTKNASSSAYNVTHDYLKVDNNQPVTPTPDVDEADLYVTTTGTNSGDCTNIASPCLTLAYAVTQATAGDLIQIGPGTFTETSYITVPLDVDIRGSGIDVTYIKGAAALWDDWDDYGWEFAKSLIKFVSSSEQNGNQYIKDLTIDGSGTAALDGTGPAHPATLHDRGMYGGIWVDKRNNVTIEGIKVRKCFFNGIFLSHTRNAKVLNSFFIDNGYGQTAFATGNIQWGGTYTEDMEIAGNDINENWGNGLKAFGPPDVVGTVTRSNIHGNHVTVTPTGQWNSGSAPNIAMENWGLKMIDCQLYDNYFDATISLVHNEQDDDAIQTVRVYNNVVDLIARGNGLGYALELSVSYAEVDHNYFVGGRFATIANYQGLAYPTNSPWYGHWDIHHNSVLAPVAVYPSPFLRSDEGIHETNIYNNTIEVAYTGTGTSVFNLIGVMAASQSSSNINIKNNVVWGTVSGGGNAIWWPSSGGTVTNCVISFNDFYQITQNALSGVTYSNNITTNPQMNKAGAKPDPYYIPVNGGNLNNTGTDVGLPYQGAAPDMGAYEFD